MKKRYWVAGAFGLAGAAVALKLFCRPRDVVWIDHAHELHHAEHSRFAVFDGGRVHYQEAGAIDDPPVLLIHGFTASNFVWSEVLLPIAESGFHVIAPDLIGFGFSEKPKDGEYTIDAQARSIIGLMDQLRIERAILVGSSYGGAVAATCALDYPDRVERLVLVDAVTNDQAKRQLLLRLAVTPLLGDMISPLLMSSQRVLRWRMKTIYAPGNTHLFDQKRLSAHHRPLRASSTQRAALASLRRWRAERIEREAESIQQPTLLVWGDQDQDVPVANGRKLFELMPNARLVVFNRCGHMPMEEYPREFTEVLVDFCRNAEEAMSAYGS